MIILKDILDNLPEATRQQLFYAFEHGFCQVVKLPQDKYIGVNVADQHDLTVELQVGDWSYGRTKPRRD